MLEAPSPAALLPFPARGEYLAHEVVAAGLRCAEARYPARLRLREHAHANACLTLVLDGAVEESGRAIRPELCAAGTLVVRPQGEPHADHVGSAGARLLEIELGRAWSEHPALSRALRAPLVLRHPRFVPLAHALQTELHAADAARELVVEGLGLELLGFALRLGERGARAPSRWLGEAAELLEARFREPLRLGALAAQLGVHPVSLARAFRARFGVSPGDYVRRLRVRWAAQALLERPERPIAELAREAGFYDQAHFSRAFRSVVGTTPARFRSGRLR